MRPFICGLLTIAMAVIATPALAYVDPGMSLGSVAVVLGGLVLVILVFIAILWYPLRRLLRKMRHMRAEDATDPLADGNPEVR